MLLCDARAKQTLTVASLRDLLLLIRALLSCRVYICIIIKEKQLEVFQYISIKVLNQR